MSDLPEIRLDTAHRPTVRADADDLPGTERLSGPARLWLLYPYVLLTAAACLSIGASGSAAIVPVVVWLLVTMMGISGRGLARSGATGSDALVRPSEAVKAGYGAVGMAVMLAIGASFLDVLGPGLLAFYVLNGAWVGLTALAVHRASRTDAQTGWMTGATSMAAACTFFGIPLAVIAGFPLVGKVLPLLCAGAIWQTWQFLSSRGVDRSGASLKALAAASAATLLYLPAAAAVMGFSFFEAACHLTAIATCFGIPLLATRRSIGGYLPAGGSDAGCAGLLPPSGDTESKPDPGPPAAEEPGAKA